MKVLLIQPPIEDFYQTSIRTQPIGLCYLAAILQRNHHEVEILDCRTEQRKSIPLPVELSYLKDFYPFDDRSPFKLYSGYYHFGMGWEEIKKEIQKSKADVFGISSSFTPYHGEALRVAQLIKEWDSRKIVVMGGAHISCAPEEALKSPFVDYVILGEGEYRFSSLVNCIANGKEVEIALGDGIGFKRSGEIRINRLHSFIPELDSVPLPARDLLNPDRYRINRKRSTMIITSRGCPHGCAYCSTHLVMGSSYRVRSPENIVQEMAICRKRYGIEAFDIEDDNFTLDRKRAEQLMRSIIETFGEKTLELSAMNGISFASLDGALLSHMKKAGFRTLNLSIVSTKDETKERMNRPSPVIEFDQILEKANQTGMNVIAYAILGIPGQTIEEMTNTLISLMGKRVLIGPSIYYPVPRTPLFERCQRENLLPLDRKVWRSSAFPIETKAFHRMDLVTLLRLARLINFIKGRMDEGELEEGMTWRELFQILKGNGLEERRLDWKALTFQVIKERGFFSLRKESKTFSVQKEPSSQRVLDYFLETSWEKPILKSRND